MDRRRICQVLLLFLVFFAIFLVYWYRRSALDFMVANPIRGDGNQNNHDCKPYAIPTNEHVPTVHAAYDDNTIAALDDVYKDRLLTAKRFCDASNDTRLKASPRGKVWSYVDQNTSLHYCGVPKVGCTTWKSIFRYLYKDFPKDTNPARPSDIDRHFVHYAHVNDSQETSLKCFVPMRKYAGGDFFMFTRDPYSRLWSAYIDKFFLPDFWQTTAVNLGKLVRKPNSELLKNQTCFNNITFEEFLRFVVATKLSLDQHWAPIHTLCNPCHAAFDFIGQQETFFEGYKYILARNRLSHLIEQDTFETRAKHETSMLIKYNFGIKSQFKGNTSCFDSLDVAKRLWRVFQYNGYVHAETGFPENAMDVKKFEADPNTEFSKLVRQTLEDQSRRGATLKGQKRAKMVEAYKSVPIGILKDVQDIYFNDFGIFGYEMKPSDIF